MNKMTVYRRFDGKQAQVVNYLKQGDAVRLYKVNMVGYEPIWINAATFKSEFSIKPITEKKYRTPQYNVTA